MSLFEKDTPFSALLILCAATGPALAQDHSSSSQAHLSETVVTATRVAQPLPDLLADVSVIDKEAIERGGFNDLASVLARQGGVQIVRTGGMGSSTSIFLRGANTQHTAVFVDGVRVDSQSGSGGMDWQTIPLPLIERIEVLRGPAAAVYGSDAMGGVIQIFTKKGETGFHPSLGLGLGNRGTLRAEAGLSGAQGAWDYALGLQTERTDGFNSKTSAGANPDDDDYRLHAANAKLGLQMSRDHRLEATALSSQSNSGYDTSQLDDRSKRRLQSMGLQWAAQWSASYSTRLSLSQADNRYETVTLPKNSSLTETQVRSYLLQNQWVQGAHTLTANLERREDRLDNRDLDQMRRTRSQNALALGWGYVCAAHTLQLNARHDDDSEFGGKNTGSAAYGYAFAPGWKATASAANSFRAPTLYQRFHKTYGSPDLQPEQGRNFELGLRWSQGGNSFSAVAYRNNLSNLIEYDSASKHYSSVSSARLEGLTLAGSTRFAGLRWNASLDFQNPRNEETGKLLARRSKRFANLSAEGGWGGWQWTGEMQTASGRYDKVDNQYRLGGYTLFNLSASRTLSRGLSLIARVDNLLDKDYTLARDYATAGRVVYVGLKWSAH
ncbi:TonB-dependent receptor domain-containing protein [Comamonas composti]|uniref:TonB-dependent receptor domain-containing protein n=1 Tax=Comamonas composti TaxID=408558 RepID=UPI0003FE451C|nr:TonB-dependent receptor [Comamonas composti]